jgi:isochorismate synthase
VVAWRLPDGRGVVGRGLAHQATTADLARWAWAGREARRLRGLTRGDAPGWLPLTWLGGSFGTHTPTGPWAGWPVCEVRVPRWLVYTGPEGAGVVGHAWVRAPEDLGPARALLERGALALTARLDHQPPAQASPAPSACVPQEPQRLWERRVSLALDAIARDELDKVVLARGVEHRLPTTWSWDVGATLAALHEDHPSAHVFAWSDADAAATFLGASPELLGRTRGQAFETVALAGTAPRHPNPHRDRALATALLESEKDEREHGITLEAIRAALAPHCTGVEVPARPRLRQLSGVQHLETPIHAELSRPGLLAELAQTLHPTPAVGSWPRAAAEAWLDDEPLERGWFAAPLGWLDGDGDGLLAVAIRSALLAGQRAWSFAGAGIVSDSDPAAEWNETEVKLRAVGRSLSARQESTR